MIGNSGHRTGLDLGLPGSTEGAVDVCSGNLLLSFVDLLLPDLDTPITVGRTYNSLANATQALGPGWRLNTGYELELDVSDPTGAVLTGATGAVERFTRRPDGTFAAGGAFDARLRRTDTGYALNLGPDGSTYGFDDAGRIARIADPDGDRVGDGRHALVFATTTVGGRPRLAGQESEREGRQTWFFYDRDARVFRVTDLGGRRLTYGYTDGQLTSRTIADLAPHRYAYDEAGRLSSLDEGDRRLLRVAYDDRGRVRRTATARPSGALTLEFDYGTGGTTVRGSDGRVRSFDAETGGVVGEDRVGSAAPKVTVGGSLPARLPRPVDPAVPYTVVIGASPAGEPIEEITVVIDGGEMDAFTPSDRDPTGVVAGTFEFLGEQYGPATLVVEIAATTIGGSATTRRLVVRVPESEPEPHPFPDEPGPDELAPTPGGAPLTPMERAAAQEREAHRRIHETVLRYAQDQPDFAGSWIEPGDPATPVVAFSGDLERHRSAIEPMPQAPGLRLVHRPRPLADLQAAARRALGFRTESGQVFSTSVDARAGRPVVHVGGRLSPGDRQRLTDLIGLEPAIVAGGKAQRRPRTRPIGEIAPTTGAASRVARSPGPSTASTA